MDSLQDIQAEAKFFDRFGDVASGYDVLSERSYHNILSAFDRLIAPGPGELLVDLGCGSGAFTIRLYRRHPKNPIIGVDISPDCIRKAGELLPEGSFVVGDITAGNFSSESVDVVTLFGVLHHFRDFRPVVREIMRILKPGGRFFAYDPHLRNPALWLYRSPHSPLSSRLGVTENELPLTARKIKRLFADEGVNVSTKVISGVVPDYAESAFVRRFMLPINKVFDSLLTASQFGNVLGAALIAWGAKSSR